MAKFSPQKFSDNLTRLMNEAKISLAVLSKNTNIAVPTLYRYMDNSKSNPTAHSLQAIADFFGVTFDELVSGEPNRPLAEKGHYRENKKYWTQVPILTWKESINWENHIKEKKQTVITDINISANTYALKMEEDLDDGFRKDSTIIVDPDVKPEDKDYLISYKSDTKKPLLKRLQKYEGVLYLKPLVSGISATPFTAEYIVLGVVRQIKLDL